MLFTTLGTMWLSLAIAPCVLAATLDERPHNCCPQVNGNAGTNKHMHDEGECISCEVVEPLLQSAGEFINLAYSSSISEQPVIYKDKYNLIALPVLIVLKFHSQNNLEIPRPPPQRFHVLLI
jgi:hypothetical protein